MSKSRFVVLKLSHITRMAIIALIGLIILIALILIVLPRNKHAGEAVYNPGSYTANIVLHNKPVSVIVTVDERKITSIELSQIEDNVAAFYPLFKPTLDDLSKEIIRKQTTNVTTNVETMYTSQILLDAVNSALGKAAVNNES